MNILLVDDNEGIYTVMKENFAFAGHTLHYAHNTEQAVSILRKEKIEIVLLDIMLGSENGIEILKRIKKEFTELPVIMITGFASVETAVSAMKIGAFDYLKKPLNFDLICQLVEEAAESFRIKKENVALKGRLINERPPLITLNPVFSETLERAKKLAATDLPILILGENGTGKELVVDFIYHHSSRIAGKLNKINCAAFTETLLDNELFGHEKGAFTGADSLFNGIFEQSDGGTLFLDEIGDMTETIQVKILRVLQNQEIRRIGGHETIHINVRFIGATNRNPEDLIRKGKFREDLYYRLNTAVLQIPPLRERKMDLPLLTSFFLSENARQNDQNIKSVSPEVETLFEKSSWPGNVRELKNILNYATTIASGSIITPKDLPPSFRQQDGSKEKDSSFGILQNQELELIRKTLSLTGSNKSETARVLKMSRNTLYQKMKRYGIQ